MGGLSSLASLGLNVALSQQAARRENKDLQKERDRQLAAIMRGSQETERKEAAALRRRQASERARAGATGTSTTGGSIDAILRGMETDVSLEGDARRASTAAKVQEIRESFGQRRRNNLLTSTNRLLGNAPSTMRRSLLG